MTVFKSAGCRRLLFLVTIFLLACGMFFSIAEAEAGSYDAQAAVDYALANCGNYGNNSCNLFVVDCLKAGGVSITRGGYVDATRNYLLPYGTEYSISLKGGYYVYENDYPGKCTVGDVVFIYCNQCNAYMHTWIVTGTDSSGHLLMTQVSPMVKNTPYWNYSHGSHGTSSMSFSVIHIESGSPGPTDPPPSECETYGCSSDYAWGWYRVTSDDGLNINSGHNWDSKIAWMPTNAEVWVSKKAASRTFTHVTWNGVSGIASFNFLERADSYTLTLNDNGGSGGQGSVTVWQGISSDTGAQQVSVPWRDGYTFLGYYCNGNQMYDNYGRCTYNGSYWSGTAWNAGCGFELYAQWERNFILVTDVTLSESMTAATVGETLPLSAIVLPADATNPVLAWESSAPDIASVDSNGHVTALAPGYAQITASVTDGSGESDFCIVNVYPQVINLTVKPSVARLCEQAPFNRTRLQVTLDPEVNVDVLFESSNPEVAVVSDDGVVTAVGTGRAVINAFVNNGPSDSAVIYVVSSLNTLTLPSGLETVEEESFTGIAAEAVVIPAGCEHVGSKAFADNPGLRFAFIPRSVYDLAEDAFQNDENLTVIWGYEDGWMGGIPCLYDEAAAFVPVRRLTLPQTVTLAQDDFAQLEAVIEPALASNQGIIWESSDPGIVTVSDEGTITAIDLGSARITAKTVDGSGISAGCTVTVTLPNVQVEIAEESFTVSDLSASSDVTLEITGVPGLSRVGMLGFVIYDEHGTKLASYLEPVENTGESYPRSFDLSGLTGLTLIPETTYRIRYTAVVSGYSFYSEFHEFATQTAIPRLKLSSGELRMISGEQAQLTATILNHEEDEILWRTSNYSIASVLDGLVQARGVGTATITARLQNDTSILATCTVTVESGAVLASEIELSQNSAGLTVNVPHTLTATVYPEGAEDADVVWASSDTSVVTVADGVLSPRAAGTAIVTASISGRPEIYATCTVNVSAPAVSGISLSNTSLTLAVNGESRIQATVTPADTGNEVSFSTSNAGVATVDANGLITAMGAGTAEITASAGGKTAACQVTVREDLTFYDYSTTNITSTTANLVVRVSKADSSYTFPVYGVRILNADGSVYDTFSASNPYPSSTTRVSFEPLSGDSGGCSILLNPSTTYYWQIFLTCNGLTYYSRKTQFTTKDANYVSLPISVSASYSAGPYYTKLLEAYQKSASTQAERFVSIAQTQKGYKGGTSYGDLSGNGAGGKYTEYNNAFGRGAVDWCAYFVSWCARMADVPTSILPTYAYAYDFSRIGTVHKIWSDDFSSYRGDYKPQVGDLVLSNPLCYDCKSDSNVGRYTHYNAWDNAAHVAIVAYVYPERTSDGAWKFITIERGNNNTVESYTVTDKYTRSLYYTCQTDSHGNHTQYYRANEPAKQFNYFVHPNWSY